MLNLNQERLLGVTLGTVEEELRRLRQILNSGEEERLFSHVTDDLTREGKKLAREKIEHLMEYLAGLKHFFDLRDNRKELALSRVVQTTAVYLEVELSGVMSDRLGGYGKVDAGLKKTLDPKLNAMIHILREME